MEKHKELQHKHLRNCFREYLVHPILGKYYYNMSMDVYGSDKQTCIHILDEFRELKRKNRVLKRNNIFLISFSIWSTFVIVLMICLLYI